MRKLWETVKFILFALALSWAILQHTWTQQQKTAGQIIPPISATHIPATSQPQVTIPKPQPVKRDDKDCQGQTSKAYQVTHRTVTQTAPHTSCI